MGLAGTAAKLLASLDLDTKPFERGVGRVSGDLNKMEGRFGRVSTRAIALGSAVGVGIERLAEKGISLLFNSIRSGEEGLRTLQDTQAQTAAVIESTGGAAGTTAEKVRELAEAQEALTTVDDKVVQSGENMLLTFTNIGEDIFPQATKAMVDMAVAMNGGNAEGIDLKNTAIQIGKALNDPIKGVTALRKVGVQLTDQQEKQIKKFVESGDIMSAQKIILGELSTEFGKAGEAAGTSGAAGVRRLADAQEDLQIQLATGLSPALERIRSKLATTLSDPKTQAAVLHLGEWLGDAAEKGVEFASKIPWGQVADGLRTAAGFAGKLVEVFVNMPPAVQGSILALAGLNKLSGGAVTGIVGELGKGLIKGVLGITAAQVNIKAATVTGGGGAPGATAAGAAKGGIGVLGKMFLVGEAIGLVAAVNAVRESVQAGATQQAQDIHTTLKQSLAGPNSVNDLKTKLAGIDEGIRKLEADPLAVALVTGPALDELKAMRAEVVAQLNGTLSVKPQGMSPDERQAVNNQRQKTAELARKMQEAKAAQVAASERSRSAIVSAERSGTSAIVSAIHGIQRPIVSVSVTGNYVRTSYSTGGTVTRTVNPNYLKLI